MVDSSNGGTFLEVLEGFTEERTHIVLCGSPERIVAGKEARIPTDQNQEVDSPGLG